MTGDTHLGSGWLLCCLPSEHPPTSPPRHVLLSRRWCSCGCFFLSPTHLAAIPLRTPTQPPRIGPSFQDDLCRLREASTFIEAAIFCSGCLQTTCHAESVGLVEYRCEHSGCETFALTRWMSCQHPQVLNNDLLGRQRQARFCRRRVVRGLPRRPVRRSAPKLFWSAAHHHRRSGFPTSRRSPGRR